MYILAIETTGAFASVALSEDGNIIGHVRGHDRFSHLQNLMIQVDSVIKENKLSLDDINAIAVSKGPGSFTGIRIGVSSARALSQVIGIPCIAVPTLEALAYRAFEYEDGCIDNTLICPILDARRSQIYGGGYIIKDKEVKEVIAGAPYSIEDFMTKTAGYDRILLFGDGYDSYEKQIKEMGRSGVQAAPESIRYQDAVSVARLGKKMFDKGKYVGYLELKPDYMRLAEAERKLREKQQKGK